MKTAVIIPARYEASRLPGKPLLDRTGKYLIQHVWERAREARVAERIIVATDDTRIKEAVEGFGGECWMTRDDHRSGTDRIAEVASQIDAEVIVNVQGDEPNVDPALIDRVAGEIGGETVMSTAAAPIRHAKHCADPNRVKVVLGHDGCALYFSRAGIPYDREGKADLTGDTPYLWHIGIYGYERGFLLGYKDLPRTHLEEAEKLEQLRAVAAGVRIKVVVVEEGPSGIDTREDYERFIMEQQGSGRKR